MTALERKTFAIDDVLSAYSGYLVSRRHMSGVYDVLNFLTGDSLFTHQLPRAMDECRPHLKRQHPVLDEIDCSGLNPETLPAWVEKVVAQYGETLTIEQLPDEAHEFRHPVEELESMVGKDRVIALNVGDTPRGDQS